MYVFVKFSYSSPILVNTIYMRVAFDTKYSYISIIYPPYSYPIHINNGAMMITAMTHCRNVETTFLWYPSPLYKNAVAADIRVSGGDSVRR